MADNERPSRRLIQLIPGNYYLFNSSYYLYKGVFETKDEVPPIRCLFVVGGRLYKRVIESKVAEEQVRKRKAVDNSRLIDTTIRDEDNELMVITKELLSQNGVTIDQFKSLFDNVSDMNNMRRAIECGGQGNFSWNRFIQMTEKLGYSHKLSVIRWEDAVAEKEAEINRQKKKR